MTRVLLASLLLLAGPIGTGPVNQEEGGDLRVLQAVAPHFPEVARRARVSTRFQVRIEVNADGVPITAVMSPKAELFREAVEGAAREWRFRPASDATGFSSRNCEITFIFKVIEYSLQETAEITVFRPPLEMEIIRRAPPPEVGPAVS